MLSPGNPWPSTSEPDASMCGLMPVDTTVVLVQNQKRWSSRPDSAALSSPLPSSGCAVHVFGPAENPGPTISLPSTDTNHGRLAFSSRTSLGAYGICPFSWQSRSQFPDHMSPASNQHRTETTSIVIPSLAPALLIASCAFLFQTNPPGLRSEDCQ
jgi:hypothetical protein